MILDTVSMCNLLPRFGSLTRLDCPTLRVLFSKTNSTRRVLWLRSRSILTLSLLFSSLPMAPTPYLCYHRSTLRAVFPRTLVGNITFIFISVSGPVSFRFPKNALPEVLRGAQRFLLDNPISCHRTTSNTRKTETNAHRCGNP